MLALGISRMRALALLPLGSGVAFSVFFLFCSKVCASLLETVVLLIFRLTRGCQ